MNFMSNNLGRGLRILLVTREIPKRNGSGSSQRAWNLLTSLAHTGSVELLVISRPGDLNIDDQDLAHLHDLTTRARHVVVDEWAPYRIKKPAMGRRQTDILDTLNVGCSEAPKLSRSALGEIADAVSRRDYDLIVAQKLSSASIMDAVVDTGLITAKRRIADFDDILSSFKQQSFAAMRDKMGVLHKVVTRIDDARIKATEISILRKWDTVTVCKTEDVQMLKTWSSSADVELLPNVVERPALPARSGPSPKLLFVGLLSYLPNKSGLIKFLKESWPIVLEKMPDAVFDIVGMHPTPDLMDVVAGMSNVVVHANVASVEPYYQDTDVCVIPLFLGSGTRVKALEAMAYVRPIVSTTLGIEGLGMTNGVNGLIADDMRAMALHVITLLESGDARTRIAAKARQLHSERFSLASMQERVEALVQPDRQFDLTKAA